MLHIALFGTTTVVTDEEIIAAGELGRTKARQVLEILALSLGSPVGKERLADLLWGDDMPKSYVGTLESYVCLLRRRMGDKRGRGAALMTTSGGYMLDPGQVTVDLGSCRALLSESARADSGEALDLVERALAMMGGDLLCSDPYTDWAIREREGFRQELVTACTKASRDALAIGDHQRAATLARTAVDRDSLAESAWQNLMRALWAGGRRAEALRAFHDLREHMLDLLGVEPDRSTHELYLTILRDEAGPTRDAGQERAEVETLLCLLTQALGRFPGRELSGARNRLAEVGQLIGAA